MTLILTCFGVMQIDKIFEHPNPCIATIQSAADGETTTTKKKNNG